MFIHHQNIAILSVDGRRRRDCLSVLQERKQRDINEGRNDDLHYASFGFGRQVCHFC